LHAERLRTRPEGAHEDGYSAPMTDTGGDQAPDRCARIVYAGTDIVGPATAAGIGLAVGGPIGALLGAAATSPLTRTLRSALGEFAGRHLGKREIERTGAVLLAAQIEIEAQLAAGKKPRKDNVKSASSGAPPAEEIAEAAILASQRDAQQLKAPLMGRLLARLQFEPDVDSAFAYELIRQTESITYRQLCLLSLFNLNYRDRYKLPDKIDTKTFNGPYEIRVGLLQEIVDLHSRTMLQQRAIDHPGTDLIVAAVNIAPARQELVALGGWLYRLIWQDADLPLEEMAKIASTLQSIGQIRE